MKKTMAALLVLAFLFGLCSCGAGKAGGENGREILLTFRQFLDGEGFAAGLSESDLVDRILPRYTYGGKTVEELAGGGENWDGVEAEGECYGWSATEERFGASWAFFHAKIETSFYTTVALDGLTLPFGLCFGDSRTAVLQKIGLLFDPGDFSPDADLSLEQRLLSEDGMELRYGEVEENATGALDLYWLAFRETGETEDGRPVERSLELRFDETGLAAVRVRVEEKPEG